MLLAYLKFARTRCAVEHELQILRLLQLIDLFELASPVKTAAGTPARTSDVSDPPNLRNAKYGTIVRQSQLARTLALFENQSYDKARFRPILPPRLWDSNDPRWAVQGGSKAKRLRYYLRHVNPRTALDTLNALWEYREASGVTHKYAKLDDGVRVAFFRIIERLGGTPPAREESSPTSRGPRLDASTASSLAERLLDVAKLEPQPRGYEFERFLKDMFDACGLSARASFRLTGEQIDGSFEAGGDVYLLEAKWTNDLVGAATLRAFNAKVEDKAKWSRGLLLSYSGFSPDGLTAFGSGRSVICMDGRDLHQVLSRGLDFVDILAKKARWAAETGQPFVSVENL